MGDYNNPYGNNNDQSGSTDPKPLENGQQPYQQGADGQPDASKQNEYQQFGQNPAQGSSYQNNYSQGNQYQNNQYQGGQYQNSQPQNNQYQNSQPQNNQYQNNQYQNNPYQNNSYQANQYRNSPYLPVQPQSNGMAIGALVCGIIGFLFSCCLWYIAIPLSIAGIVLGILVIKNKKGGKNMAIVGIVLSSITIVISIVMAIVVLAFMTNPEFSSIYEEIYNEIQSSTY